MGSNQFQREYIEYLQDRNTELIGKLNHMKENYENKILSKDLKKHYLTSTLEDVLHICTQMPQDIDLFFDKMSAAMDLLKNILLRKSEMLHLVEKISKIVNSTEDHSADLISLDSSSISKEPMTETRNKRTGTVKVSPMINGHVISTEPRIYLSRVPEVFTPRARFDVQQLSPIIEVSPNNSSDLSNKDDYGVRDVTIPLERIDLQNFNFRNKESPKSRFKGPKTWKKSLSSTKRQSENGRVPVSLESKETLNKKFPMGEIENLDPLEGPSWLYNENEENTSLSCFTDYRRRKHRFATVFDKNEDYNSSDEGKVLKLSPYHENKNKENSSVKRNGGNENVVEHELGDDIDDIKDEIGNGIEDKIEDDGKDDNNDCLYLDQTSPNSIKLDVKEFKNIINESSGDLFSESYSQEKYGGNISPCFKVSSSSASKRSRGDDADSENKSSAELENNFTREMSTSESADTRIKSELFHKQPHSSSKRNKGTCKNRKSKKSRKCHTKCSSGSCKEAQSGVSVKKVSPKSDWTNKTNTSECKIGISEEEEDFLIKDALEKKVFVRLENYLTQPQVFTEILKRKSPSVKLIFSDSKSPEKASDKEGRKKRKAAPTLKLVEPSLRVKLRRS